MAITRSSCMPAWAPVLPSGNRTKPRHSPSSRPALEVIRLLYQSGVQASRSAGRLMEVVSQPASPVAGRCGHNRRRFRAAQAHQRRDCFSPPPPMHCCTPPRAVDKLCQLKPADMSGKFGTLQPRPHFQHLDGGVIAFASPARRIHRNQVLLAGQRRQPYLQFSIAAQFHRGRRLANRCSITTAQRPIRRWR